MAMSMEQIHRIKELQLQQKGPYQIAKDLGVDPKTVRKYMEREDFSPTAPLPVERASKLDPYKKIIAAWLASDEKNGYKQRHTAQRVFNRLANEFHDFTCSYPTVVRYVRSLHRKKSAHGEGFLELQWHPGEAQADFGQCDIVLDGTRRSCHYLVVSFPYSNAAFVQCFLGETAECFCQGLMDIFEFIQRVPRRLVIDNATAAGHRMGEEVRLTQLFKRFQSHFQFEVTFCNPASGHEKGNVENKVGYVRRNYFVPMPSIASFSTWNAKLLGQCEEDNTRQHYKKQRPMCELFEADKQAMRFLPRQPFEACRYEIVKTNGYGKFVLDGRHTYSSAPMYADREILVRVGASSIEPLDNAGNIIDRHLRAFGSERTDTVDWETSLDQLITKPGAWRNSLMRSQMSAEIRTYMDEQDKSGLRQALRLIRDLSHQYDMTVAIHSMQQAIIRQRTEGLGVNAAVLAARIAHYGLDTPGEPGPDLKYYDTLLPAKGGSQHGS